ncbi:uncharacterized protein LOC122385840 isoform X2 [Amphibalanus amphitrite]|uniref:uncharacterized protein LOC122385840 isoform X2 n=1 Tax=Amphibalanus amphitrite TaxID=1232801 RepID=UPI001C8FF0EA|nr:uncharacterized protein LOC122385840 isoform X2 [Amphibalanus amphitrite]
MRLLWILLPILAQGAFGALFKEQPPGELVVHRGDEVTLTCITNEDVSCAWKLETPALGISGFLSNRIPPNVDITARDPNSARDCTIVLQNVDERYNGKYRCSPYTSKGGQEDSSGTELIIAEKPKRVYYIGEVASGFPLEASSTNPTTVQCMAEMARPKAEIVWYLGNTQLYDSIEVQDTQVNSTGHWNSLSTLTYQFHKEDNGKSLRCVASHAGYDKDDMGDQQARETAVDVDVQFAAYRPGGNNIGRVYGFTAGQPGEVTVNFTANPVPSRMFWKVGDTVQVPAGGTDRIDRRFSSGMITVKNASLGMYALTLTIDPVQMEDQSKTFVLQLENSVGSTALEFQIGTGAPPPPEAALGATIGGIVAAVVVLIIIIALVAFGRSRGKWCFAEKAEERSDGSDTESAHAEKTDEPEKKSVKFTSLFSSLLKSNKAETDAEMGEKEEEKKELTKPEADGDGQPAAPPPKKEGGEVVYAELVLNSDGVKTEVRPSADKTEYAVIVGTKQEADAAAEDNKNKE